MKLNILQKIRVLMELNKAEKKIEEAYKMNSANKPGWKTTEFWMTVATNVVAVASALKGVLSPQTSAIVIASANSVYSVARAMTKANTDQPTASVTVTSTAAPGSPTAG